MISPASPDDGAGSKLVRNEQLKLTATLCNNLTVAFLVTGAIAPIIALNYGISRPQGEIWGEFLLLWATLGGVLHHAGRAILKGLAP